MNLPFLPGNSFDRNVSKTAFQKSQQFFYSNNIQTNVFNDKGKAIDISAFQSSHHFSNKSAAPSWVVYDKQVLSFDGLSSETVTERLDESERIHRCKIYYFLEDGTMKVTEPKEDNSGMEQGVLVKRHHVNKPPPNQEDIYTIDDLNIGNQLSIYGICYTLIDCDEFTKRFLRKIGVKLGEPMMMIREKNVIKQKTTELKNKESKFWKYDGQVLKFSCLWEDENNQERRKMILKYHLTDDTIEIIEVHKPNSGREGMTFLNRCRLPKQRRCLDMPGNSNSSHLLLNVFQNKNKTNRCMVDSAQVGDQLNSYRDCDLRIGSLINVFDRKFLLCDCDDFTKEFYRNKYGITNFTPIELENNLEPYQRPELLPPPYNGFGSHEDSLNSSVQLLPRPPRRDFIKFLTNDRQGLDGNVLRYSAQLLAEDEVDGNRRFILSFFLVDDTLQIYEVVTKNSGLMGGRYLERCKVPKPGQEKCLRSLPEYYQKNDLTIGKLLEVNGRHFVVTGADEYTMKFMEKHCQDFPESNINSILLKISSTLTPEKMQQFDWSRTLSEAELHQLLDDVTDQKLSLQEIHSISRHLLKKKRGKDSDFGELLSEVRSQLKRNGFQEFPSILESCYHFDVDKSKLLPVARAEMILKAMRLPVNGELLCRFLNAIDSGVNGFISYEEMVDCLNWKGASFNYAKSTKEQEKDEVDAILLRTFLTNLLRE